ncbi:MAG: hypothetical protein M3534_16370 [Actinomycetota bacterium]|nr:hypothetical protein [Actinomycetota bacterium]
MIGSVWAAPGITGSFFGISWAIGSVGVLTFLSGAVVAALMREEKGGLASEKG